MFGEIARERFGVDEATLNRALQIARETGEPVGQVLVNLGVMTEKQKVQCLGEQWGIPFIDLEENPPPKEAALLLPVSLCERHTVVPLGKEGEHLRVAMARPLDVFAIDEIRLATGLEVEPYIATEEDIVRAMGRLYTSSAEVAEAISELVQKAEATEVEVEEKREEEISTAQLVDMADEAPVVRMVNMVIVQGVREGASDIHIQPEADRVRVRYRIDGVMMDSVALPKRVQNAIISRVKILADMDIAEKRVPQDGRITLRIDRKAYDFRVSTFPGVYGEKVVMRILDKSSIQVNLAALGLSTADREKLENLISKPYGIILVTGPTGSGKSTTLYALLNRLNSGEKNIITVEDPVEYELPGLTQAQVNERAGLTFATGLRSILRQDPDIIMVGEIRDSETAMIATEAALTGHLVLSTLHTNDAPGAIARLVEMGVEPFLVASAVIGVQAQRLVRVICPRCKVAYKPQPMALKRLGMDPEALSEVELYRGQGCEFCRHTGYKGRTGCFELMVMSDRLRDLILQQAPTHVLRQVAIEEGMTQLREDAMRKVLQGITTVEEALRVIFVE